MEPDCAVPWSHFQDFGHYPEKPMNNMTNYKCWQDHNGCNDNVSGGQEYGQACAYVINYELL